MMKYEIRFHDEEKAFAWRDGIPDRETAMFYAEMERERAVEKFEEYGPDETYTPDDFNITITGTEDKNVRVFELNGWLFTGITKEKILKYFGFA